MRKNKTVRSLRIFQIWLKVETGFDQRIILVECINYLIWHFIAHFGWNKHWSNGTHNNKIEFNWIQVSIYRWLKILKTTTKNIEKFQQNQNKMEKFCSSFGNTLIIIEVPAAASKLIMVVNSKKMMPLVAKAYCWKKLQIKIGSFYFCSSNLNKLWNRIENKSVNIGYLLEHFAMEIDDFLKTKLQLNLFFPWPFTWFIKN